MISLKRIWGCPQGLFIFIYYANEIPRNLKSCKVLTRIGQKRAAMPLTFWNDYLNHPIGPIDKLLIQTDPRNSAIKDDAVRKLFFFSKCFQSRKVEVLRGRGSFDFNGRMFFPIEKMKSISPSPYLTFLLISRVYGLKYEISKRVGISFLKESSLEWMVDSTLNPEGSSSSPEK